jgi:hypothetical protein
VSIDRVKPLKIESIESGGDSNDEVPTGLDPEHDHVECAGIVLDDPGLIDESTVIWRDTNDMKFKDGNNPGGFTLTRLAELGGASTLHPASLTTTLSLGQSEIFGRVTGLSSPPLQVVSTHILELVTPIESQSGYSYSFEAYNLTSDGFSWRLRLNPNEYEDTFWPDTVSVTLKVYYLWSET